MSLRPRHYVLIAVILGLFVFNIWRRRQPVPSVPPVATGAVRGTAGPALDTPAWRSFDKAAGLRDAASAQFDPAMHDLLQQVDIAHADPAIADVKGCLTWLEFYRQGALHPSSDPQWKQRSEHHLNGCVQFHLDTSAP